MRKKAFWTGLLLATLLFFNLWTQGAYAFTEGEKLVLQSWRLVNQSYLDETFNNQNWWQVREKVLKSKLETTEDAYNAIEQMLASLGDPFTRLLRPEQYQGLRISTTGELSGVGLQININPDTGGLEVVAPLAASPGERAGIAPHDRILAIDGVDTTTLSLEEAAEKMRGLAGTKVSLRIQSAETNQVRNLELIRDRISLNPVVASLDKSNPETPIGYLRLNQFSANAAKEIAHGIAHLQTQGAKAYILDLRNNPGGLLQAGIEIARLWLNDTAIVYTVNRQGMFDSYMATEGQITDAPLVVLVNQGTASSSEILAGALQDNGRALLVGEKTFGKGLIQSLFELPEGAGLAVTVAKYETPNHRDINKLGILPDEIVSQEPITYDQIGTELDKQYQTAVELLTTQTAIANAP